MIALTFSKDRIPSQPPFDMLKSLMNGSGYGGVELGLYEKMLRAAVDNPEGFADVNRVLSLVSDDDGKRAIKELYQTFYAALADEGEIHDRSV